MRRAAFNSLLVVGGLFGWLFGEGEREPRVVAHYMPWFRAEPTASGEIVWEHWQWYGRGTKHDPNVILPNGRRDIAAVNYPLIGPYHGRDPVVLEYHMLTAKAAGIDGFVADWYGPGTYSDQVFGDMVKAAERYGMTVGICMEEKALFPPYSSAATREDLENEMYRHLRHVLDTHGRSEAYLRRKGDPVVFIFNHWGDTPVGKGQMATDEVARVLTRIGDQDVLLARTHFDEPYNGIARGNFAWCSFDPKYRGWFYPTVWTARHEGRIDFWAGMANPGFDDSGVNGWGNGPRLIERRGTKEYEETWADNLTYKPDAVQIVTWNDFEEGTTIEPAVEYGFTYVDLTERFVRRYTGRKSDTSDNAWPFRLYTLRRQSEQLLNLETRDDWRERLDDLAQALSRGRRFGMEGRLKELEQAMEKTLLKQIDVKPLPAEAPPKAAATLEEVVIRLPAPAPDQPSTTNAAPVVEEKPASP
jgi:glycoprotein endo-alpha-1,2-mannosidase